MDSRGRKESPRRHVTGLRKFLGCFWRQTKSRRSQNARRTIAEEQLLEMRVEYTSVTSKPPTSDSCIQTEDELDKAALCETRAEVNRTSKPSTSDSSTQTADQLGDTALHQTLITHPAVERPVEIIRAIGKAVEPQGLQLNADLVSCASLHQKGDAAALVGVARSASLCGDSVDVSLPSPCGHSDEVSLLPSAPGRGATGMNFPSEVPESVNFMSTAGDQSSAQNDFQQGNETYLKRSYSLQPISLSLSDYGPEPVVGESMQPDPVNISNFLSYQQVVSVPSPLSTANSLVDLVREPPGVSHRFLSPKETERLIQMYSAIGKFSYYILNNRRVIIHPEDDKATENKLLLKSCFMETTGNEFDVIVKDSSFVGTFCTHRIGAKMLADGQPGTVGLYVRYNGILYFISSAHNFVLSQGTPNLQSILKHEVLHDGKRALFDVLGKQAPIGKCYYLFSNTCRFEDEQGRIIMHSADISICQAPIFTHVIEKGMQQFTASLQEGQDPCRDCCKALEECSGQGHRRDPNPCQYKVSGFYDFGVDAGSRENGQQHVRSNNKELVKDKALVRCRPSGRTVVAGRVISFDNVLIFNHPQQIPFEAYNVLLIKPENESAGPKLGDSGSVWVLHGTELAVAITIGMGKGEDDSLLWAAAPLQPLLQQLACAFKEDFPDPSKIEPVQLYNSVVSGTHGDGNLANQPATLNPSRSSRGPILRPDSAYVSRFSQQNE